MSKKSERLARQAEVQARKEREQRIRIGAIVGGVAVVVIAVIALIVAQARKAGVEPTEAAGVTATEIEVPDEGQGHVDTGQPVTYNHYPPSSGLHWGEPGGPVEWQVYSEPVRAEAWIHNLEHGGIVVLYSCPEGCPDTVEALKKFAGAVPASKWGSRKVVVAPDAQIPTKIVALAWGRELDLSDFDQKRLLDFYKLWVDRGPEDAP